MMLADAVFSDGGIQVARRRCFLVNDTVNLFLGEKEEK